MPLTKGTKAPARQKVNEKTYPVIKQMIDSNAFKATQIQKVMGLSASTYYRIKSSKDLEDYRAQTDAASNLAHARANAKQEKEDEARNAYLTALAAQKEEAAPAEPAKEVKPDFTEALLEQIVEELREINKKLSQTEILQKVKEEDEEEDRPIRRSFFGINKPF